jgi:hypothetical protein
VPDERSSVARRSMSPWAVSMERTTCWSVARELVRLARSARSAFFERRWEREIDLGWEVWRERVSLDCRLWSLSCEREEFQERRVGGWVS